MKATFGRGSLSRDGMIREGAASEETVERRDPVEGDEPRERYIVPGLKRGLAILQLFDSERTVLRLSDIVREIQVPRSSAFRLVYTLESIGFVERTADGHGYRLGSRVLSLGFAYLSSVELVEVAREPLAALRFRTRLSTHLAVREGREIVHLIRMPSREAFSTNVQVGLRRPAHATPMGRVLLCELPDEELRRLYPEKELVRVTEATAANVEELERQLATDRARGYVVSLGTYIPSGCSVAAPIRDATGTIVAAINIVGPRDAAMEEQLRGQLKNELLAAAAQISQRLGYVGRISSPGA